jgi:hypothetical protein
MTMHSLTGSAGEVMNAVKTNCEIIAASQGYETKANAEKSIESVKTNAPSAAVVDLTERESAHN